MTPKLESALVVAAHHGQFWYLEQVKQLLNEAKLYRTANMEKSRLRSIHDAYRYLRYANETLRAIQEFNKTRYS